MSLSNNGNGMGPADIAAVVNGGCGYGGMGGFGGGWGGGGIWDILVLFLLYPLLGGMGFGGMGWGGMGAFGRGGWGGCGAGAQCATPADVHAAVDQQTIIGKLDGITNGICDSTYAVTGAITNGFSQAEISRCQMQAAFMQQLNAMAADAAKCCCETREAIQANTTQGIMNTGAIQRQISDCCCDLEKMNMQNRFDAQQANCTTLQAIDKLGDRIIGHLTDRETQALRDENQTLKQNATLRAAIDASTAEIIRRTGNECPTPAYFVPNPHCCYGNPLGVGYSGWNGGGCGNCA